MKILICGEYGVFCKELIGRLKKEKHTVFVLTGSEKPSYPRPRDGVFQEYNFSYRSRSVGKILQNIQVDAMIILGACDIKFAWKNKREESVRFLTGMTNLLMCAKEAKIPQIIYCSSTGIFEEFMNKEQNVSSYEKSVQEILQTYAQVDEICKMQDGITETHISKIRIPEMYGDYRVYEYDICSKLMDGLWNEQKITVSANREHRIIHVKDAVEAVMRVFLSEDKKEVYNLEGQCYTEKQIVTTMQKAISGFTAEVEENCETLNTKPAADMQDVFKLSYRFDLETGVREQYKEFGKGRKKEDSSSDKTQVWKEKIVPYVENIVIFFLVTAINLVLKDTWFGEYVNFYLFYMVLLAVVYGTQQALFASALLFAQRLYEVLVQRGGIDYTTFIEVIQILIVGVSVGYMRDKYKRKNLELEDEKKYFQSELVDMTRIYDGSRYLKEVYEKRLMGYENSMARIYEVVRRLDFWEPQKVVFEAIDVIQELLEIEHVAIYITGKYGKYLRLLAASTEEARKMGKSICVDENFFMYKELKEKRVYRNKQLGTDFPAYACGVFTEDNLTATVMLWTDDLSKINLYEANMFVLLCHLIEAAMSRARVFWNELSDQYIEGTTILQEEQYTKMHELCRQGKQENKVIYSLLYIPQDYIEGRENEVYPKIQKMVRETDYMGRKKDGIYIILMNANESDADFVWKRFRDEGIPITKIIE